MLDWCLLIGYKVNVPINLSIIFHLSRIGSGWQQAKLGIPDILLPCHTSLLGDPKMFRSKMGYIIPAACSGSTMQSRPSWTYLEDLQKEETRRHHNQLPKAPQLALFSIWGSSGSTPTSLRIISFLPYLESLNPGAQHYLTGHGPNCT